MITNAFVWLVALLGLVLYLLPPHPKWTHPKVTEVGRLMFFAGLLAILLMRMRAPF